MVDIGRFKKINNYSDGSFQDIDFQYVNKKWSVTEFIIVVIMKHAATAAFCVVPKAKQKSA